jgi:diacylglycerol kinase (ATP)
MNTSESNNPSPQIPRSRSDVLVLMNPKAGSRSGQTLVDAVVECLGGRGMRAVVVTDIAQLARLAESKMAAGTLRAVVAAGGDGTVGLVANRTPVGTPIAILPLGTENLLAKYFSAPADPVRLAESLAHGRIAQLDAGEANGRVFLLMAGCGFDAEVVRRMHDQRIGHISHLSYFKPILDSICNYPYPEVRIHLLDSAGATTAESVIRAKWVFVVNLPRYAGGLRLVPQADGADGLLDVCTFREGSLLNGLIYLAGVIAGQHQSWEDCVTAQVRALRMEADQPVPLQLDGDPAGHLPVDIRVLPRRLTFVVAENWQAG